MREIFSTAGRRQDIGADRVAMQSDIEITEQLSCLREREGCFLQSDRLRPCGIVWCGDSVS